MAHRRSRIQRYRPAVMKILVSLIAATSLLVVPAVGEAAPAGASGSRYITKAQYGKRWPFTVKAGTWLAGIRALSRSRRAGSDLP
jgi:hypothetical protein